MKDLVDRYLRRDLSRRRFVTGLARWGFSVAAASSIVDSLAPLAQAADGKATTPAPAGDVMIVEGTGGKLLLEQLRAAGIRYLFNCNASGTRAVFDALVDTLDLQVIQLPHEGQMVAAAEGFALATNEAPFTLNGSVGLQNTLNNMYNAWKDRTPMVIGAQREPSTTQGGRDAFEDWDDYLSPSAAFSRWRWDVQQTERIPEITRRAFKIAATPPAGPVALSFAQDRLEAVARAGIVPRERFLRAPSLPPTASLVDEAARLLLEAEMPILLVGPEITRSGAQQEVIDLAEELSLPVVQSHRLFVDFPNQHPLFLGDSLWPIRHSRKPGEVDCVLALGAKIPYERGIVPARAKVIHVSTDADAVGRVVPTDVGIVAGAKETARALTEAIAAAATSARRDEIRATRLAAVTAITAKQREAQARATKARWDAKPLSWERVMGELDRHLEPDAVLVPELAWRNYASSPWTWEAQFDFRVGAKTKIGRTTGSALGWGVGAALGVKLAMPDRQVVALQGDGGFLFAQAEVLWSLVRYEIPILIVICNNRSYNGPRHKALAAGGRQGELDKEMTAFLGDPDVDFARIASGFGVAGEVVAAPDRVAAAIKRGIAATRDGRPYLIDFVLARTGRGAGSTWHPKFSLAATRTRKV